MDFRDSPMRQRMLIGSTIVETDLRGEKPSSSEQHTHLLNSLPQLQPLTGLFHTRWRQSYSAVNGLGGSPFLADNSYSEFLNMKAYRHE